MKNYAIRYLIEQWNKPPGERTKVMDGVSVSVDDYGYADRIFVASTVIQSDGTPSVMLIDSEEGPDLSVETCNEIIEALIHFRDHHATEGRKT